MREERLEVSVTFDERGYIGQRTRTAALWWRSAWAACAARSRSRCCLMTFASCCNSMVSTSGNVIGGRRRRSYCAARPTDCPPGQRLLSAEADVRPPRRKSGFDPI